MRTKSMKKLSLFFCGLLIFLMAGCGGAGKNKTAKQNQPLILATGPANGTYLGAGTLLSQLWNSGNLGFTVDTLETSGSVANIELIQQKRADLGIVQGDVAYEANAGRGTFRTRKMENLQQLGVLCWEPVQIVTPQRSGIKTLAELKDKIIAVGAAGSGSEVTARHILMTAGLTFTDVKVQYLSLNDAVTALRNGTVDAAFLAETAPLPMLKELAAQLPLVFLGIPDEQLATLTKENPQYRRGKILAGTYPGLALDVPTAEIPCVLVATDALPKERAAALLTKLLENPAAIHRTLPQFPLLTKAVLRGAETVPWAPGAEQSYQNNQSGS